MERDSRAAQSDHETVRSPGPAVAPAPATRPYYECVFCKRGFTTAQALGGHMNIHRRDRDRLKPAPPTRRPDAPATMYGGHSSTYPPPHLQAASPMSSGSFAMLYYTGGAGAAAGVDAEPALSPGTPSPRELSLFGSDDDRDRGLQLGLAGYHGSGWRAPEEFA